MNDGAVLHADAQQVLVEQLALDGCRLPLGQLGEVRLSVLGKIAVYARAKQSAGRQPDVRSAKDILVDRFYHALSNPKLTDRLRPWESP